MICPKCRRWMSPGEVVDRYSVTSAKTKEGETPEPTVKRYIRLRAECPKCHTVKERSYLTKDGETLDGIKPSIVKVENLST